MHGLLWHIETIYIYIVSICERDTQIQNNTEEIIRL